MYTLVCGNPNNWVNILAQLSPIFASFGKPRIID